MQVETIVSSKEFKKRFPVRHRKNIAATNGEDNGMGYLNTTYENYFPSKNVYFVLSEHQDFQYPDGSYEDGTTAYSDFSGDMPIAVLEMYLEKDGSYTLASLCVAETHRGQKLFKKIVNAMVEWVISKNIASIGMTRPSEMGEKYTNKYITDVLLSNQIQWKMK